MNELRPLLETSDDELTRALLDSARDELPTAASLRDAALALGLTLGSAKALAATLPSVSAAGHAGVGATASVSGGASGAATAVGSTSLLVLGKTMALGALASFVALSTLERAVPSREVEAGPRRSVTTQPASTVTAATPAPAPAVPDGPALASPEVVESTAAQVTTVRKANPAAAAPASPAPQSPLAPARAAFALPAASAERAAAMASPSASLAAEIRLLDQVRAALSNRDFGQAGRLLDTHASRPSQVLAREATRLRVQLLLASGQTAAARALARRDVAQHPEGADAALRQLADEP